MGKLYNSLSRGSEGMPSKENLADFRSSEIDSNAILEANHISGTVFSIHFFPEIFPRYM